MKLEIDPATFVQTGTNCYGKEVGTIAVNGELRQCVRSGDTLYVYGYVGRYRSGAKLWPARVSLTENADGTPRFLVDFGRDDRAAKFRKENAISYQPEAFAKLTNREYWIAA